MSSQPYPWRLRIEHEGRNALRLERPGRTLRFDPLVPPRPDDIVALSWNWPEHLEGTARAVEAGERPTVLAHEHTLAWLSERGPIDGLLAPVEVDGLRLEQLPYTPIPWATPTEALHKAASALRRPDRAVRRLLRKRGLPDVAPVITHVRFPDGAGLLHLNLSLHRDTPAAWLDEVVARFGSPEWLIVGVDHGHGDAVLELLPRLGARFVILTDLLAETRRELGLPVELLTPLGDRATARGLDAYIFVSGAGLRFE
jgi:hypothetical protein